MEIKDPNPCRVIGVLDDGVASLNATALALLRSADVIIGGARTLALLEREFKSGAVRHDLTGKLKEVSEWVRAARADNMACVVLATGDPLCHGIAPYLAQHLCVEALDILPNLSTLQLACARIGLAWQDARIVSGLGEDDGHAALLASLIDFTEPLIASQHAWSRFSRHALWAMVTSSWAAQFAAIGRRIGCEEKAVAQARRLMEGDAEIAAAAPLLYAIRAGRQTQTCQRRAACCLYFKGPRQHFCASCPIIPPAERIARNRDWVATGH